MVDCDKSGCHREFDTIHAMKTHYGLKDDHDGSIAGVEMVCDNCGDVFRGFKQRLEKYDVVFCSESCNFEWQRGRRTGEDSPSWKGGGVVLDCEECGDEYEVVSSRSEKSRFCSNACKNRWMSDHLSGSRGPNWKGGKIEKSCDVCGEDYEVSPGRSDESVVCSLDCRGEYMSQTYSGEDHPLYEKRDVVCEVCGKEFSVSRCQFDGRRFCSIDCKGEWMSQSGVMAGRNNHQWEGGKMSAYKRVLSRIRHESWEKTANRIRGRDGHQCQMCGVHERVLNRKLDVHHIVPLMDGGCNSDDLLMALCRECHKTVDRYIRNVTTPALVDWNDEQLPDGRGRRWPSEDDDDNNQGVLGEW